MQRAKRTFVAFEFSAIADIQLERDSSGDIIEDIFPLGSDVPLNKYAAGPFCRFRVAQSIPVAGVYALTVADRLMYIGECENLAKRYSSTGYGRISPRNCHIDGQSTNCKINSLVLSHSKAGETVTLWFHPTEDHKTVEARLIDELTPPWNGRRESVATDITKTSPRHRVVVQRPIKIERPELTINAMSFRDALEVLFEQARQRCEDRLRVRAGDLHRLVGGYPGASHRMPLCCSVMRKAMVAGDVQIQTPPKGNGASLTIEYRLPRSQPLPHADKGIERR